VSADFDRFSGNYRDETQRSIDFIGQEHDFFVQTKVRHLLRVATRRVGDPKGLKVLDVGCGVGLTDIHLVGHVAGVFGTDISKESIEVAATRVPAATYLAYDGKALPFPDDSFDITFAIGVVHHASPQEWGDLVREMQRVTRSNGLVVVFEHNPYNPLTRKAVRACAFDEGVELLSKTTTTRLMRTSGLDVVDDAYIVFFPWSFPGADRLESLLRWLPLGAQYFVAGRKP
jgi:ubiquinone/menaquinone biosynthesis C-methylase UbiE